MYPILLEGYERDKAPDFKVQFKAKSALEALRGDKTVQESAAKHHLHPNQINFYKTE